MKPRVYSRRHHYPTFKSFDHLFSGLDQVFGSDVSSSILPAVNVIETDDYFKIDLVAAGFEKGDFKVNTEKGVLTISAEVAQETKDEKEKYTRREFRKQSFKRSFELSDVIDTDGISAVYQDGILKLTLPKKEEVKATNKTIEVS